MIYAGAVLGAGFASGQETFTFFARFGSWGFLGVLIAGGLFILTAALILYKTWRQRLGSYRAFLQCILPRWLAKPYAAVITAFLFVTYVAMISGSGALANERFHLPALAGSVVTSVVCFIVFAGNLKGISVLNTVLTPIMTAGMVIVSAALLTNYVSAAAMFGQTAAGSSIWSAFVYVGFNLLTASVLLVSLRPLLNSGKTCVGGAVIGGGLLCICAVMVYFVLSLYTPVVGISQLPMLTLAGRLGNTARNLYSVVLYAAMLTTAVSCGFSLLQTIRIVGLPHIWKCAILCSISIPFSLIPFATVVNTFYALFGYAGILLIIYVFIDALRALKHS